jgi:cobalt-zinc-cadmium efflux system outer membrane protein
MIRVKLAPLVAVIAVLAQMGCASTSAAPAFHDVADDVQARSGHHVRWDQSTEEDKQATAAIDRLLAADLTVDGAVQVALLASPALRSKLEELSIAQADLVQAGLLKNPVFGIGTTAWEAEHISPNLFISVEQDFLDILTMPMRKKVARAELESTKLEVGDEVLKLAAEVRSAFYTAQAAQQVLALRRIVDESAQTAAELAGRQHEAGNTNELTLGAEQALASQARLDLARAEADATVTRERVTKLMGLWGPRASWKLGARLPELPASEVPLDSLETIAMQKRLDVGAARRASESLGYSLALAKTTRWFGAVSVNVTAGRLRNTGHVSFGPSVLLEIPLFDQRQAAVARLEAFKRQSEDNLHALAIDARSDVRASRARVVSSRAVVEQYVKVLVPVRENLVKLSQQQYDAMLLGVFQLIQAKQSELTAYRELIEAVRDYWIARSDLERAVGTRLGPNSSVDAGVNHGNHP